MNRELRTAIASAGSAIAFSGGFWYLEAGDKVSLPYCVFSFVTSTNSRDSASRFEDYYLQINLYDKDGSNIEVLKDRLTAVFDDYSPTLYSWIVDRFERQFSRPAKLDKVFQITVQYKIELTKK